MKKIKWILVIVLPLQWVALLLLKNQTLWLEQVYSQKIYPFTFNIQKLLFEKIPFSFGDVCYGLTLLLLIYSLVKLIQGKLKIRVFVLNFLATISLISLLFHFEWGLNYYRIPLTKKLNYSDEYNEKQLEKTLETLIQSTNELHKRLTTADTVAVYIPYSKKKIKQLLEEDFKFDLEDFPTQPYLKNSLWSTVLSYMGFAGYLNPLTLESQVNQKIPKLNYITTATHEMAHQLGIASESEANFVAYYSCIQHPDPFVQYAGYSFALRYCYSELYVANPEKAKRQIAELRTGVVKNFQQNSQFWKQFQNPFEPYFKKGYDNYLKANGQIKGIQSYNAMVSMVIAHTLEKSDSGTE